MEATAIDSLDGEGDPVMGFRAVEGPRAWSRDRAIEDALVIHRISRAERQQSRREATVNELQPQSLLSAWKDVLARLPDDWRQRVDEVFVFAPPDAEDCSPGAFSRGRMSHRIEVPRGFVWLLNAFGDAYVAVRGPLVAWLGGRRDSAPDEGDTFGALWAWVVEGSQGFAVTHSAPPDILEIVTAIEDFALDPRGAWEARQQDGQIEVGREVGILISFGLRFAVAHEVGHHLLNHLEPQTDVAELGVQSQVEKWIAGLDIEPPTALNRSELREWYADVFALMVLTKDQKDSTEKDAEFWRLTMLAAGAAVALLALYVGGESLGTPHEVRRTHPPVEERLNLLVLVLTVMGRGLPEPAALVGNDDIDAEAGVAALQVFGCAVVIMEILLREQLHRQADVASPPDDG